MREQSVDIPLTVVKWGMFELSLALLGPFEAVYKQRPLTQFRTKAVQALLIYLVCQPEAHTREALMALLWPELPTKSAQGNLRHALYHLRQAIPTVNGDAPFVLADRQTIQVNPDGRFQLDITQFETLTDSQKVADWQTAVTLYRGDFLADFYLPDSLEFESWVQARRADLRRRLLDTLVKLTDHKLDEGNFEQAEQYARQQLTVDNLREEAHRQLMMVLARNGRRTDALTHYQTLCQLLQDELGITPSSETEALVEAIRKDRLRGEAESEEPHAVPHNLRTQATPFVGRQAELADLDSLLANPQTRLVTILGSGGMGKTRLSLAVAERQLARQQFAQGIFFVPLAWVGESDRILSAIAEAMEIRLEAGEQQLFNTLRTRQILLVLDNFEHLLDGSELVRRLLQTAPQLQILVTSRERLRLQGEQVYPLQGLVVDDTAVSDDARTLFLQAARRLRPDFEVSPENLPILNHICRLVEGMPLALELAATWVDLFTLAEIAAEIQRNLNFLESDLRDIPSRHRSMQAVFDASWQRLSPAEQQLLAQVTIFKGGFSREAATVVTQASLRDLAGLVNKSLLTFDTINGRYHIHELLRQFAAAKRGEEGALRDRHRTYFCTWLGNQVEGLSGPEQIAIAHQVQADMPNIRPAFFDALRKAQFADLETALSGLAEYYYVCGQYYEGITLLRQIHDDLRHRPDQAPSALFWTLIWLANFHGIFFQTEVEAAFLQQARALLATPYFHERDTKAEQAWLCLIEGYTMVWNEPETAVRLFRRSQALLEESGNQVWLVRNLIGLHQAIRNNGDQEQAVEVARHGLSLAQALGHPVLEVQLQLMLGRVDTDSGKYAAAETQLQEAIARVRGLNHPQQLGVGLIYLGYAHMCNGHLEAGLRASQEGQQIAAEMSNLRLQIFAQNLEATCRLHLGQYEQCRAATQQARRLVQTMPEFRHPDVDQVLSDLLGVLALVQREPVEEKGQLLISEHLLANPVPGLGSGLAAAVAGEWARAREIIKAAIQVESRRKRPFLLGPLLAVAAYLYAVAGEAEQAVTLYALARRQPFIASSQFFEDMIGKQITAVSTNLSPDVLTAAQARGKEMDLWQTAEQILKT